jgi:hypothetical protein
MLKTGKQNTTVAIFFLAMVIINALANVLPINGVTTRQISDNLPNLFVPAPITFSIWGLIYLLLFGYVLYSFAIHEDDREKKQKELAQLASYFCVSCLLNASWIIAWHYGYFLWSTVLMVFLLISLILARFSIEKMPLRGRERLLIRLPFTVYLAWISVATIASVTTSLVHAGWGGWGIAPEVWTSTILILGVLIGGLTMLSLHGGAYGLVLIWAYGGILLKHFSPVGFAREYPGIIFTISVSLLALILLEIYLVRRKTGFER